MKSTYLCRQFLLSDQARAPFDGWVTCTTFSSHLHYHPELPVSQLRSKDAALTLVGYCIDPDSPELFDAAVLGDLFQFLSNKEDFVRHAQRLAGRWVLFAETPTYSIALHDACGLRRLFYSDTSCAERFCASEASTAAKVLMLEKDRAAVEGFEKTRFAQEDPEYWWPGDATQFKGVRALLPNHYLDLTRREVVRYCPGDPIGELSLRDSAERSAHYLTGLIRGVASRFELALPLTAGWDSRAILAACKAASVHPHCYTLRLRAMTERSQDIAVPRRLLAKMRWTHHVIDCAQQPTNDFVSLYKSNADPAHDEACQLAFALWRDYPRKRVTLSGHCSEIARTAYYLPPEADLSPADLVNLTGMDSTPFVLDQFDRWLAGAKEARRSTGASLQDLFYWEQRVGRWAANGQSQWDMVHERFTPFNCRPLLFTLLAVPAKYRSYPDYRLYRRLIEKLSSSVLSEPVNPDAPAMPPQSVGWFQKILKASSKRLSGAYSAVRQEDSVAPVPVSARNTRA
jgi:hypothetical protein